MKLVINKEKIPSSLSGFDFFKMLDQLELDSKANIKHCELKGEKQLRYHLAEIPIRVGCHVHFEDNEQYWIISGIGELFLSTVGRKTLESGNISSFKVSQDNSFIIEPGIAHQLVNRSEEESLIIVFACPDSHLNDNEDRFFIKDICF